LFAGALAGGAQALGQNVYGLVAGAAADFISLAAGHPALVGRSKNAALDSWIFAARQSAVDGVWRRGKKCVSGGQHHLRDRISARFSQVMKSLLA
jgi:cytosine/adenosine deaminase-related metal-dependent hydrolase